VALGIHIAAPALAGLPGSTAVDLVGRARLSTVYVPGYKVAMLPDEVVQTYALSRAQLPCGIPLRSSTKPLWRSCVPKPRLESVPIAHNLRRDQLDAVVTEPWLTGNPGFEHDPADAAPAPVSPCVRTLAFLYRLAKEPQGRARLVRGKPRPSTARTTTFACEATTA